MDLVDKVRFLGFIDPKDVFSFWKSIDIACFPSYTEGFGLSVLEAMASRVPIVAYANPAFTEAVAGAGILVPIGDVEALAHSLQNLLDDGDLRLRYQRLAYERAQNFTKESMVEGVTSVYREILSASR